ncbi:ammonium transporter [Clostridium luticellarii]|jgi:Amt family ammonium transporter|uniref:Ammonium transporter n=1 Tax=Clostridium luticellarii TaxID=1691940 RepID=A0A2T0BSQ6_9CLOT|nr:ammonium transporter [Clostridium luticellarii]PRR86872.1 Ammonium transporter NrgA [Clostridium luticellarii]
MNAISGSDTTFVLICAALVLVMTPGLASFYGGMVRGKNTLNSTLHSYSAMAIVSIQWVLIGYTIAFGTNIGGFMGGFNFAGLKDVGFAANPTYASTIPHEAFMIFQMMFALITPALISGAVAERMKFLPWIAFLILWSTFVYDPIAHWVWGDGGWLKTLGALDFAGGNVVHISSGVSALVLAVMLGKRKTVGKPSNLPLTCVGVGLLWFGWFGFNAGSALGISSVTITAFITTNTSAAAAAISWATCEYINRKKITSLGVGSGVLAGLVAITPAAGFVSPLASILIGLIGGVICYSAVTFAKTKFGYDDALDAFGCHGVGGMWGGIATGIFAWKGINSAGANGLIHGDPKLVLIQLTAIVSTIIYSALVTFIIVKIISAVSGSIRVSEKVEETGIDVAEHGEQGYGGLNS